MAQPLAYDLKTASAMTGTTVYWLRQRIRAWELQFVYLGRKLVVPVHALEERRSALSSMDTKPLAIGLRERLSVRDGRKLLQKFRGSTSSAKPRAALGFVLRWCATRSNESSK